MTKRLEGKIAFISGTGSGQGAAAAELFCREGATVVGCDLDAEASARVAQKIKAAGGRMISLQADVGDEEQARSWIESGIRECGGIDILYNNAGACRFGKIDQMSTADWHFTVRNEIDVVYFPTKHATPHLKARGAGSIINIASVAGVTGSTFGDSLFQFAHSATKGSLIAMSRTLAAELGPHNIRVNAISPGLIGTPRILERPALKPVVDGFLNRMPIKRMGTAQDIALCALYLASDESSFVTGQNFCVDGGVTIS